MYSMKIGRHLLLFIITGGIHASSTNIALQEIKDDNLTFDPGRPMSP